jgi:hypothetical protein
MTLLSLTNGKSSSAGHSPYSAWDTNPARNLERARFHLPTVQSSAPFSNPNHMKNDSNLSIFTQRANLL